MDDEQEDQQQTTTSPGENKEPVVLDTLEDLVDQMEIEISDHEDEQTEQKVGVVSTKDDESAAEVKSPRKGQGKKRLRRTSTLEGAEFRPISLDYQLCDDDIIELMQVLQVITVVMFILDLSVSEASLFQTIVVIFVSSSLTLLCDAITKT